MIQDSSRLRALYISPLALLLPAITCFCQASTCAAQTEKQPDEFLVRTTSGPLRPLHALNSAIVTGGALMPTKGPL